MTQNIFNLLSTSKRNMKGVNPKVMDLALELIKISYHHGINVVITDGYRSYAEQNKLYAQGRTTAGKIVTNAKGGQSIHNFGYAVDFCLVNDSGAYHWNINADTNSNLKKDWFEVAAFAKKLGFDWGGDWLSFKDYPHLDFQKDLSLKDFQNGKRPKVPNVPKRGYIGVGDTGNEVIELQKDLNKQGCYNLKVDGVFADGTRDALKDFQSKHKLTSDGVYGSLSKKKLKEHV